MSLTKQALLEKCKQRFEWVDIPDLGRVGIRTCPAIQSARRWVSYQDQQTGEPLPEERAKAGIHQIIDQLMESPDKPMFTDDDFEAVASLSAAQLTPIIEALDAFNGEEAKNG